MYIRTLDDALEALAEILDTPERREQIIKSTVRVMLCLDVPPRLFLADCQALLIEGGLDALRARRREAVEAVEDLPIAVFDPVEDKLFDEIASALDALRFAEVVRQVFPGLHTDRWPVARAILLYESGIREQVTAAIKSRQDSERFAQARDAVHGMVDALRPSWGDRLGALRSACLAAVKTVEGLERDQVHQEAELLFEVFASSDSRATAVLAAVDSETSNATELILRTRDLAMAARDLQSPPPPQSGSSRVVA